MKEKLNIRFVVLLVIISVVGLWRIFTASEEVTAWSNFSPVGALALFGGCYFMQRYKSYLFPILILLISDLVMMNTVYAEYSNGLLYSGWYWTYGGFALMVLVSQVLIKKVSFRSVVAASIVAALVHFVVSNFGVWMAGGTNMLTGLPYGRDFAGLINCYAAGLPFMKNTLLSNLLFGGVLFGGFELAKMKFAVLRLETASQ